MKRKISIIFILFLLTFTMSCIKKQDYGIITGFYIKDSIIYWDDIEDAIYYEIFVDGDMIYDPFTYTFVSESKVFTVTNSGIEYNIQIKVFYENSDPVMSDTITFFEEAEEYITPSRVGRNYMATEFSWYCNYTKDNPPINYTLLINGEKTTVETNEVSVADLNLESGVYKIQVRANYENGSSDYSIPYYKLIGESYESMNIEYMTGSNEDLIIPFENAQDIIAVEDARNIMYAFIESGDGIITINKDSIVISKEYLNMFSGVYDYTSLLSQFRIYTEDSSYLLSIMGLVE